MKNLLIFIFIVSIPALLFAIHDFYIFYEAQGKPMNAGMVAKMASETRPAKVFDFTSVGFLLNRYSPAFHQSLLDSMTLAEQENFKLFLTFKAFYLSMAFALIMSTLGIIFTLLKTIIKSAKSKAHKRRGRAR